MASLGLPPTGYVLGAFVVRLSWRTWRSRRPVFLVTSGLHFFSYTFWKNITRVCQQTSSFSLYDALYADSGNNVADPDPGFEIRCLLNWSGSVGSVNFLGRLDPDSVFTVFVRIREQAKKSKTTYFRSFVFLNNLLSLKTYVNVPSEGTGYFLIFSTMKFTEASGSGAVIQWYGSADLDSYQNVRDPEHRSQRSSHNCGSVFGFTLARRFHFEF